MAIKKVNYTGSSKVIIRLCEAVNALIDGGGGGSTVTYTQTLSSGTQTGSISIDGVSTNMYAPTPPSALADLSEDSTHRVVTDTEKSTWSGKVSDNPTFSEASARANIASGESFATILGKIKKFFSDLKTVAFTGAYSDLTGQPTIPTVNDATLTLTQGGSTLGTFTANASSNVTIDVPSAGSPSASSVSYDNTVSGLTATDVQDAIDEVVADIPTDFVSKASGGTFNGNVTVDKTNAGTATVESVITAGNNKADGTTGSTWGTMYLYGQGTYYTKVQAPSATANRAISLPDKDGTVALTSDIPDMTNVAYKNAYNGFTQNQGINRADGTSSTVGYSDLYLGNGTASGTNGNSTGRIIMYGSGTKYTVLETVVSGTNKTIDFPDKAGTVALTSDLTVSHYVYKGALLHGGTSAIFGYGVADVIMFNGLATINFELQVTANDAQSTFDFGIDRDYLTSTVGKTITPVSGGIIHFFNNGALDTALEGFAGTTAINNQTPKYWLVARMYTQAGGVGPWASNVFTTNTRITGTIYGTYS